MLFDTDGIMLNIKTLIILSIVLLMGVLSGGCGDNVTEVESSDVAPKATPEPENPTQHLPPILPLNQNQPLHEPTPTPTPTPTPDDLCR